MITNQMMKDVFDRVDGNVKEFYKLLCTMTKTESDTVNMTSLYSKAKQTIQEMQRLKKFQEKMKYKDFCNAAFLFPKLKRKNENTIDSFCKETKHQKVTTRSYLNQIHHLTNEIVILKSKLRNIKLYRMNERLRNNRRTIDRLNNTIKIMKRNTGSSIQKVSCENKGVQCNTFKTFINDLKSEIEDLKLNDETGENVDIGKSGVLNFRENTQGKPYNSKIRELYYVLRSRNIALEHIDPIIRAVLSVVDIEVDDLPSISTAAKLTSELGVVSRAQLSEELMQAENVTMHRDATTKKGRHFYGVEFSTGEKVLTAGLREVHNGKGETYVESTHVILNDIATSNQTLNNTGNNILCNVSNFMTDRSVTEQKVNNILTNERNNVLCEAGDKKETRSFKCSVHPLLQFSDVCKKEINLIEKEYNVNIDGCSNNESVTHFLLRCVSKLFFKDGSGDPLLAATYLKQIGILNIPIINFRGNRFNTLFYNSAGTFYLHQHLIKYLQSSKCSLNFIQSFIVKSLQNNTVIAIMRALGILCKILTEPYWQHAAGLVDTALGMGTVYRRIVKVLKIGINTPDLFLKNDIKLFYGPTKKLDCVSAFLFLPSDIDNETLLFLKRFCEHLKCKCDHLFKDFLNDGKYVDPSLTTIKESQSCPANNITVERLMSKLDSKLKSAPTMCTNNIESLIVFKNNNTEQWLASKEEGEKSQIVRSAMKSNRKFLNEIKDRKKILFNKHLDTIRERELSVQKKGERKEKNANTARDDLKKFGLWEDEGKIRFEISKFTNKKDKISILKKQINLYKTVYPVHQANQKQLLLFSKNGKQHDVETLIHNLSKLIEIRKSSVSVPAKKITEKPTKLVGKTFCHTWTDNGQDLEWLGKVYSYKKGIFQVQYWHKEETYDSSSECFELTKEEIDTDYEEGNFYLIEDHENTST